jgi:hydroxymethylbilane synthase
MKNMHPPLRLGTRASAMAIVSAEHARSLILKQNPEIEIEIKTFLSEGCQTPGDLKDAGGKGLFIKDLERRLLAGEIDCAIHTLKDVPGDQPLHPDLVLIAFLEREDPRDALVLRDGVYEKDLVNCVIGTSAPRRIAMLHHLYPGVRTTLMRGNADTRIKKLDAGACDAVVLSAAGLVRLGLERRISRHFDPSEMLPAVGQGILCIQVRKSDADRCTFLRAINDEWAETAATIERDVLYGLQGNCHSAIAAHCTTSNGRILLDALVLDDTTGKVLKTSQQGSATVDIIAELGQRAAADLLSQGARAML